MDFKNFFKTYNGVLEENRIYRWVVVLLLILNMVLVVVAQRSHTVILVPPTLKKETKVSFRHADRNYKEAWGFFFANMLGNVTPSNIEFIQDALQRYMAPRAYQEISSALYEQAKSIKNGNMTISFAAREVSFDENEDRVQVKGQISMRGSNGKAQTINRVYSMDIQINDFAPIITDLAIQDSNMQGAVLNKEETQQDEQKKP